MYSKIFKLIFWGVLFLSLSSCDYLNEKIDFLILDQHIKNVLSEKKSNKHIILTLESTCTSCNYKFVKALENYKSDTKIPNLLGIIFSSNIKRKSNATSEFIASTPFTNWYFSEDFEILNRVARLTKVKSGPYLVIYDENEKIKGVYNIEFKME